MNVYTLGKDSIPRLDGSSITLGTFDGVHTGHRCILDRVLEGKNPTVVTFDSHPQHILMTKPGIVRILTPLKEKLRKLELLGIERVVVIPFTKEIVEIHAESFLKDILIDSLSMDRLVVGFNHAFGKNREGNIEFLKSRQNKYGFALHIVDAHEMEGITVSSTKIRNALNEGQLDIANNYLGWPYRIRGEVVPGGQRGRNLGYPTANINPVDENQLIPIEGVYVIRVRVDHKWFSGVGSIGKIPTFGVHPLTIEAHLFDVDLDLYGNIIDVEWIAFLRPQQKFESAEALIQQMKKDEELAREVHSRTELV